jgi:hypothetical protein
LFNNLAAGLGLTAKAFLWFFIPKYPDCDLVHPRDPNILGGDFSNRLHLYCCEAQFVDRRLRQSHDRIFLQGFEISDFQRRPIALSFLSISRRDRKTGSQMSIDKRLAG